MADYPNQPGYQHPVHQTNRLREQMNIPATISNRRIPFYMQQKAAGQSTHTQAQPVGFTPMPEFQSMFRDPAATAVPPPSAAYQQGAQEAQARSDYAEGYRAVTGQYPAGYQDGQSTLNASPAQPKYQNPAEAKSNQFGLTGATREENMAMAKTMPRTDGQPGTYFDQLTAVQQQAGKTTEAMQRLTANKTPADAVNNPSFYAGRMEVQRADGTVDSTQVARYPIPGGYGMRENTQTVGDPAAMTARFTGQPAPRMPSPAVTQMSGAPRTAPSTTSRSPILAGGGGPATEPKYKAPRQSRYRTNRISG